MTNFETKHFHNKNHITKYSIQIKIFIKKYLQNTSQMLKRRSARRESKYVNKKASPAQFTARQSLQRPSLSFTCLVICFIGILVLILH